MTLGVALEVQVVQGHAPSGRGCRAAARAGNATTSGRSRRSSRGSVQAMRSSWERAGSCERLDAVGDELRVTCDRDETQVGGDVRQ